MEAVCCCICYSESDVSGCNGYRGISLFINSAQNVFNVPLRLTPKYVDKIIICASHDILLGRSDRGGCGTGWGLKKYMLSFVGDLKVGDHLKDIVVDRLIILKRILG